LHSEIESRAETSQKVEERIIRYFHIFSLLILVAVAFPVASVTAISRSARAEEHFSVKQYNEFHDLLHPLEHEALPNKDFRRIRANARKLVRLGKAMVRVGVPRGTAKDNVDEFRTELRKFNTALNKFSIHAKAGNDTQLETSFSAVHDSFEMLVGMLPRK
jgi:hypothetical protein